MKPGKCIFEYIPILAIKCTLFIINAMFIQLSPAHCQNFTTGAENARLFGIHEITLTGLDLPAESTRFSKFPIVRFTNSEKSFDIKSFYDGDGNGGQGALWKARLYIIKEGSWSWTVTDNDGIQLKGKTSGNFIAFDSNFSLKGKFKKHTDNSNRWATERNPGNSFLALGDTHYTLMDKVWSSEPDSRKGNAGNWNKVIDNSHEHGVTLIRAGAFGGYSGWNGSQTVGPKQYPRPNWPWKDEARDGNKDIYDLDQLVATDTRIKYSLNKYEDLYFELIMSPKVKMWGSYWEHPVYGCTYTQIENYRNYMTARYSAYPNIIFQLVYDIDFEDSGGGCGANPQGYGDENYKFAQNWLEWLVDNDPFNTMRCIGNGNDYDDPFLKNYYNQTDPPPTYIHDEAIGDISGITADKYYGIKKAPVFHGEDTYELDVSWGAGTEPSENNPEYYYRRLFWADLLSGAYPCYGGGYKAIVPYDDAYEKVNYYSDTGIFDIKLRGLNDIIHIKKFFADNKLDIADFHPADFIAINGPLPPGQIQVACNDSKNEFLIYHPNASPGEENYNPNDLCEEYSKKLSTHFACKTNNLVPSITIKLDKSFNYIAKWFDPSSGHYFSQYYVAGQNDNFKFIAPSVLKGKDAILFIKKVSSEKKIAIIGHRGGRNWAPENTLAAYKKCAENNIDWETDLNLTADGEIILMHDMTLDRTTNAKSVFGSSGIPVNSKTLKQIKTLDAGSHFSSEYSGEKIPTLDEFLDYFLANAHENSIISMDTKLDKLTPGPEVYQSIIDKIAARNLFDRVFIEVFSIEAVNKTRTLHNGDKLNYAIWVNRDTTLLEKAIKSEYFSRIHASNRIAYKADDVHNGGVPFISAHPVETRADWDIVKNYTIDGVSTDKPDVTLFIIRKELPACSINEPANGSVFHEGTTITIRANTEDTDSSITKIEFYINESLRGFDTSYPYSYAWFDGKKGRYSLTVKVIDNDISKLSEPVIINIK